MGAQWKQKGREAAANAKGKIFSKLAKELIIAARGGADPATNARLRMAVEAARNRRQCTAVVAAAVEAEVARNRLRCTAVVAAAVEAVAAVGNRLQCTAAVAVAAAVGGQATCRTRHTKCLCIPALFHHLLRGCRSRHWSPCNTRYLRQPRAERCLSRL